MNIGMYVDDKCLLTGVIYVPGHGRVPLVRVAGWEAVVMSGVCSAELVSSLSKLPQGGVVPYPENRPFERKKVSDASMTSEIGMSKKLTIKRVGTRITY